MITITKDSEVILEKGYGHRDLEKTMNITADTLFPLGSTTKQVGALLISQLIAEGKIPGILFDDQKELETGNSKGRPGVFVCFFALFVWYNFVRKIFMGYLYGHKIWLVYIRYPFVTPETSERIKMNIWIFCECICLFPGLLNLLENPGNRQTYSQKIQNFYFLSA